MSCDVLTNVRLFAAFVGHEIRMVDTLEVLDMSVYILHKFIVRCIIIISTSCMFVYTDTAAVFHE